MKYRRLTNTELQEIETAFVRFLASNSITIDDWTSIKNNNPDKAEGLIALFSDIVFENTLKKIEYLTHKTANDLKIFHCLDQTIHLIGIEVDKNTAIDFTQNQSPQEMLELIQRAKSSIQMYSAQKNYNKKRELELFDMMENGCLISDGNLFKTLQSLQT